jgi:hypothetical protein
MLKIKGLYLPMLANRIVAGDVYFLDSGHSLAADTPKPWGISPDKPYATLDYALSQMTASNDDILVIAGGHSETITGAGGITFDVAGVHIVGLGNYDQRPTFLMDGAATVSALVTAANVTIENLIFSAGHADVNYCFHITGKGCHIKSCTFMENTTAENWVDVIHAGTADNDYDGLVIEDCDFEMEDAAAVTAIDLLKNSRNVKIIGNRILGDFDASPYAPIYSASTEIHKNILVQGNLIHNQHDGNAAVGISIANTTSTGWIVGNHVGHQDAAGETPILAGAAGLYCGENYAAGVLGTASGYLYPAVDS